MSFEEKMAAFGRKLDAKKSRLDEEVKARKEARQETREEIAAEIDRLDAAFDEFEAAMDAQLDKQMDKFEAKVEKDIDDVNAALDLAEEKSQQDAEKFKAAFTLDKETPEAIANEATGIDDIQKATAEQVADVKGGIVAAEENVRMAIENSDRKMDALQLCTQMRVNNAKQKIADHVEAIDKAAQENWILDLLDYADACYDSAYVWTLEAEYAMAEVAKEIDSYNERFGKEA